MKSIAILGRNTEHLSNNRCWQDAIDQGFRGQSYAKVKITLCLNIP